MTETPTLDATLADIVSKAADALEKATAQYGPDAVGLALEVGRIAAMKTILTGLLYALFVVGIVVVMKRAAPRISLAWDRLDEEVGDGAWAVGGTVCGVIGAIVGTIIFVSALNNLTAIHAWVGMFRPEIYLAYEAIF